MCVCVYVCTHISDTYLNQYIYECIIYINILGSARHALEREFRILVSWERSELKWNAWNAWLDMNQLKWMNWHEVIETKESKQMNWNEWIDMNEMKRISTNELTWMDWNEWMNCNEEVEMTELKWRNWNFWNWNFWNWHEGIERNELKWMNEIDELTSMNWHEGLGMNELKWRNWNQGLDMNEIKRMNLNQWSDMNELEQMNELKGMKCQKCSVPLSFLFEIELSPKSRARFVGLIVQKCLTVPAFCDFMWWITWWRCGWHMQPSSRCSLAHILSTSSSKVARTWQFF